MTDAETRNQFIRQDSKYYDDADIDAEEDGGFESFQVLDADGERYEDEDDGNSNSDEGQFLGISESTASRQLTFAQLSQNIPENELKQKAVSVLDLINAEISDLHTRELELKKKNRAADGKGDYEGESEDFVEEGSSQADSDDYSDSAVDMVETYSRTSNSSGNVTPADSNGRDKSEERERASSGSPPRADGSFNAAEVGGSKTVVVQDQIISPSSLMVAGSFTDEDEAPSSGTTTGKVGVKVRPIVEEEVRSIELSVEKETPIEREIRLVREREAEFRRQRIASTGTSADSDEQSFPTSPTSNKAAIVHGQSNHHEEASKKISTSGKSSNVVANAKSIFGTDGISAGGTSGQKDLQYEMATARLKREMEENLMRERELFQEGRLKSLSAPEPAEVAASDEASNVTESETATPNNEDDADDAFQDGSDPEEKVDESQFTIGARRALVRLPSEPVSSQLSPSPQPNFQTSAVPPHSAPAVNNMRFFAPAGFSPQSHHSLQRGSSFSSTQTQSLPFSKAQFTSIERMILKGSFAFNKNTITEEPQRMQEEMRMTKIALMPDPLQIVHRVESIDETEEGGEVEQEEIKPRRKYVPAQDKIQKELQEQSKREKELSQLRAKWKSTPDLSKSDDMIEGEAVGVDGDAEGEGLTKPSALRRQMSSSTQKLTIIDDVTTTDVLRINKPTVRRRQSALINQWEEMIKQQQQKNNKN